MSGRPRSEHVLRRRKKGHGPDPRLFARFLQEVGVGLGYGNRSVTRASALWQVRATRFAA
jgi:hypothetical protein